MPALSVGSGKVVWLGASPHYCSYTNRLGNQGQGLVALSVRAGAEGGSGDSERRPAELGAAMEPRVETNSPAPRRPGLGEWGGKHLWGGSELPWLEVKLWQEGP